MIARLVKLFRREKKEEVRSKVKIKVSIRSMILKFYPCEERFIREVCHGYCCQTPKKEIPWVYVGDEEIAKIRSLGADVKDNLMVGVAGPNGTTQCPFWDSSTGYCRAWKDGQPRGCQMTPFRINNNGTLIIRRRATCMKCYRLKAWEGGDKVPAYLGYARSLVAMIGRAEYDRLKTHLEEHPGELLHAQRPFYVEMDTAVRDELEKGNLVRSREIKRRDAVRPPRKVYKPKTKKETMPWR